MTTLPLIPPAPAPPTPTPPTPPPAHDYNDGRDDPAYQNYLAGLKFEGRRQCLSLVFVIGVASALLSAFLHMVLFAVAPESRQYVTVWLSWPLLSLSIWFMVLGTIVTRWNLWLVVKENHAWIVVDQLGRGARNSRNIWSKKMKFGTGFYLIPPWWVARPENLVNLEKITRPLPLTPYTARDGVGAANVSGSYIYWVVVEEAEDYIGLDQSTVEAGLNDSISSRIGPQIRRLTRQELGGDTSAVSAAINATFLGADRDELEHRFHVDILSVVVRSITPDEKTRQALDVQMDAEARKLATPDLLAPLKDKDGNVVTDEVERFDRMVAAGIDPKREKKDYKVTGDGGLATLIALFDEWKKSKGGK